MADAPHRPGRPLVDRVRLRRQLRPAHPARPAVVQAHPLVTGSPIHAATVRGPAARWRTLGQLGALLPPASVDERDLKGPPCHRGTVRCRDRQVAHRDPSIRQVSRDSRGGCMTRVARPGITANRSPPAPTAPRPAGIGPFRQFRRELDGLLQGRALTCANATSLATFLPCWGYVPGRIRVQPVATFLP